MLKLYTNKTFLTETHRKHVFPLLFDLHFLKNKELLQYYELVEDVLLCDVIVFPIDYSSFLKFANEFKELQKLSKTHNKPIWIYTAGDYGFTNYIANSYTFRLGGFKSKLSDKTFIMPSFVNDPYENKLSQEFSVLKKQEQPSIGFVGHAQAGFKKYLRELLAYFKYRIKTFFTVMLADKQSFYPSSIKRAGYLIKLQHGKGLKTDFILRNSYHGGVQNEGSKQKSSQEFYNNIFNNAYTFCMRGVGNYSVRFYETLAVGRIPILLNTDCKLPLDDFIDWNKHCVILDEKSKLSLEQQILNFHNSKSEISFETIQKENRSLWETHLTLHKYFITIHNIFSEKSING